MRDLTFYVEPIKNYFPSDKDLGHFHGYKEEQDLRDGYFDFELESSAYPSISCITPGNPYVLHCFPPFKSKITKEQHFHLDIIAKMIRRSFLTSGTRITKVLILGHSSTWHKTSRSKLELRAFQRAGNASNELILRLNRMGLAKRVDIKTDGRSDTVRWLGKPYSSTSGSMKAQGDRALNRRVEITLIATEVPKPSCTDRDIAKAILDMDLKAAMKARKEARFRKSTHRKAIICISRKLTSKLVDGDEIDDDFIINWKGLKSSTRPKPIWRNFTAELKKTCNRNGQINEDDFINVYNTMVAPIENIIFPLTQVLIDVTPNPFGGLSLKEIKGKIPECRAVKPIYLRSAKRMSIYWCLRGWIQPALKTCFE